MLVEINNKNARTMKIEINRECRRFEKYFLTNPKINCDVLHSEDGIQVSIVLTSGHRKFSGKAEGMHAGGCINEAVRKVMKALDVDKNVLLKRN